MARTWLQSPKTVREFYDQAAAEYARAFSDEMAKKPMDREQIDLFLSRIDGTGPLADFGCGPGEIAAHLHRRGYEVCGIDLSPRMIEQARALHPKVEFRRGNLLDLDLQTSSLEGATAFYSVVHFSSTELDLACGELYRVLRPGAHLLLTFHVGEGSVHHEEFLGARAPIDFLFFQTAEVERSLGSAGFAHIETVEREPYPQVEYPSRRAYVHAVR